MSTNRIERIADDPATIPMRRGRPRSAQARAAVLDAAAELARAGGPAAATVDAIAKRAEVSRTTIYKWWPSTAAIVLEGLLESVRDSITRPPDADTIQALRHHLRALNAILTDPDTGPLLRNAIASAPSDPDAARALVEQWLNPRRAAVRAILTQAVDAREIHASADVDLLVDALVSPPYYRLMFGLPPLSDAALTALVDTVWRGAGADQSCCQPE